MAGMQKGRIGRVGFVSLGCPKALVDTERIVTELRAEGYIIAADYKEAFSCCTHFVKAWVLD